MYAVEDPLIQAIMISLSPRLSASFHKMNLNCFVTGTISRSNFFVLYEEIVYYSIKTQQLLRSYAFTVPTLTEHSTKQMKQIYYAHNLAHIPKL